MRKKMLLDKGILFLLCSWLLFYERLTPETLLAALAALFLSSLAGCAPGRLSGLCAGALALCCTLWPPALAFTPLLAYDAQSCLPMFSGFGKFFRELISLVWLIPLAAGAIRLEFPGVLTALLLSLAALLLRGRSRDAEELRLTWHETQDSMREASRRLERKNRELMEKQDYEVQLATLDERNRIAREIHDNVGHLLTRSILQVGALQVILRQQPEAADQLESVKSTLSEAMDRIRSSVHDLHEESIDLRMQLLSLAADFTFCPVQVRYEMKSPPREVKYCFLAIVREALNNIARHSNATGAAVTVLEHPGLYQLTVSDNGTRPPKNPSALSSSHERSSISPGLGLLNMQERVEALQGVFRAEYHSGFRLFISIPKERNSHEDHRD